MSVIFVSGLPLTQEERTRARAAIQGNASRHRWRKGAITSLKPSPRSRHDGKQAVKTRSSKLLRSRPEDTHSDGEIIPLKASSVPWTSDFSELPPPFPLGQPSLLSHDELWDMLQRCWDVLQQIFPVDSHEGVISAKTHMDRIISVPLVFQAYMFSQAIRNLQSRKTSIRRRELVSQLHSQVVETINDRMSYGEDACSDDNILAVCNLACHGFMGGTVPDHTTIRPQQGPLESLRLLDLYGGLIESVEVHLKGLIKMVELRGGLKALELPGLGASICLLEVIVASRELRSSRVECMTCVDVNFDTALANHRTISHPLVSMATGFKSLPHHVLEAELLVNLDRLALYTMGVDSYIAGRSGRPAIGSIGDQRTFVQHHLLDLMQSDASRDNTISGCCYLAAMLYDFLCVFPMPAAPFSALVSRIISSLESEAVGAAWGDAPELMTWIVFITGIASVGMPTRTWLIAVLDRCFLRLKIYAWSEAKELLQSFLWLPMTNDRDGLALWEAVQKSNPLQADNLFR